MNRIEELENALRSLIDFTEEQLTLNDLKEKEREPLIQAKRLIDYDKTDTEYLSVESKEKQALENLIF